MNLHFKLKFEGVYAHLAIILKNFKMSIIDLNNLYFYSIAHFFITIHYFYSLFRSNALQIDLRLNHGNEKYLHTPIH